MRTVYSDDLFDKYLLTNESGGCIKVTLKGETGIHISDLLRNNSEGFCVGYVVDPVTIPNWVVPGLVFPNCDVGGLNLTLTVQPILQSNIKIVRDILGEVIRFSYVSVTEFNDNKL